MISQSGSRLSLAELAVEERDARALYEGLLNGDPTWRAICPEYTCGDRTNVAIDEAWQHWIEARDAHQRALNGGDSNAA